ncbi:MAG: alpha-glucuronidase family glycosyl hydrolase, partial [Woeseiaceae bacterium]
MTGRNWTRLLAVSLAGWLCLPLAPARAEDGYELWLRYPPQEPAPAASTVAAIVAPGDASAMVEAAISELQRGLGGLLGAKPPTTDAAAANTLVLATPAERPELATLGLPLDGLG